MLLFFNFINLFIFNFFMKQIIWYMYLMQNAEDNHFSNLLVSWLSCYARSGGLICSFKMLIRQFVVFQYHRLYFDPLFYILKVHQMNFPFLVKFMWGPMDKVRILKVYTIRRHICRDSKIKVFDKSSVSVISPDIYES